MLAGSAHRNRRASPLGLTMLARVGLALVSLLGLPRGAVALGIDLPDDTLQVTAYLHRGDPGVDVPVFVPGTATVPAYYKGQPTELLPLPGPLGSNYVDLRPGSNTIHIPIDNWGHSAGEYLARISVSPQVVGLAGDQAWVRVSLRLAPPHLDLAPRELRLLLNASERGGVTNLLLYNEGSEPLVYSIDACPPWLQPSQVGGEVLEDSTDAVILTLRADNLPPGTYSDVIQLSTNAPDEPRVQIPVSLTLQPPPTSRLADSAVRPGNATDTRLVGMAWQPTADDSCPVDSYSGGPTGYIATTAPTLEDHGSCNCPSGSWSVRYDRRAGTQQLNTYVDGGWVTNADRLKLVSGTPGIPFAFEVRLRYALNAGSYINGRAPYEYGGQARASLTLGDIPRNVPAVGNTPGRRKTGSMVILVSGYPGEQRALSYGCSCSNYREPGAAGGGGSQSSVSTQLSIRLAPVGSELSSCRPLTGATAPLPSPRAAYAGISDGLAVIFWDDCPPWHRYIVEREVGGQWMSRGSPVPNEAGELTFSESAAGAGGTVTYRLVGDGTPLTSVRLTAPVDTRTSGVLSAGAGMKGQSVMLQWQTTLGGLPYTCESRRDTDSGWHELASGRVPPSGMIVLSDSTVVAPAKYEYRLVFVALGTLGNVFWTVPYFDVSPTKLHADGAVDLSMPPLEVTLTNHLAAPYDVVVQVVGQLPVERPLERIHLAARSTTTISLPFLPLLRAGNYAGTVRVTADSGPPTEGGRTVDVPVMIALAVTALHPAIAVYRTSRSGLLEADVHLVPHSPATIQLFDALGRQHESFEMMADSHEPRHLTFGRRSWLPAGVYFVQVRQGEGTAVGRGIIVR